jgi:uncharacterized protein (UPF0261 family)
VSPATIAILATLDTKSDEAAELQRLIAGHGLGTRIVDVGLGPRESDLATVGASAVAAAAGTSVEELRRAGSREEAMRAMGRGAGQVLAGWLDAGELSGAVAVGGNQGTAIASIALRELPIGLPKLILSTVASGDVRPYVGDSDIAMLFSVGDLLGGPNVVTGRMLENAAAAIAGMARAAGGGPIERRPRTVGLTAFGNTHAAATVAMGRLRDAGCHVVPFHASGACGSAMERLVEQGVLDAVLDLTIHELLAELHPEDIYAPVRPGRMTAAGRAGIPQVVVPGGLEYFCFGPPETVPAPLRDRPTHRHNPFNMNVRTSGEELAAVGTELAERLNAARGPTAVLVPRQGWSEVGSPGGALHDPSANEAFVRELDAGLRPEIPLRVLDTTINDPDFARLAADTLLELIDGGAGPTTEGAGSREERYAWR